MAFSKYNLRDILYDPDLSDVEDTLEGEITSSRPGSQQSRTVNSLEDDLLAEALSESDSESRFADYLSDSSDDYRPHFEELETSYFDDFLQSELAANVVQTPTFAPIDLGLPEPLHTTPTPIITQTQRPREKRTQKLTTPAPADTPAKTPTLTQLRVAPWVRVYPPEPEQEIASKFTVNNVGPRNIPVSSNPLTFFYLFMTNAMWALMVRETNKNALVMLHQKQEDVYMRGYSRLSMWVDVTVEEMKRFWAILINMGLISKKNLIDYWETDPTQIIPFFPKTMTLKRFQLIMSVFHLSSNKCTDRCQPGYEPWLKIQKFVDMMNKSFKKYFVPGQEVCIDESMIGMKNYCTFIQYMPNKRHDRFGIKKFEICDSVTSYVLHVSLYTCKDYLAKGFIQRVVKNLMTEADCLGKGHHLFINNYYTKIPLCLFLLSNNTFLTGTINKKSRELSQSVVEAELAKGETLYFRKSDILLLKYKEKRTRKPVHLVTTACHAENIVVTSTSGIVRTKPMLIHRYNTFMGGVKDKSIYHVTCSRPCKHYWRKIVYNFVDMAMLNAWILFKGQNPDCKRRHDFMVGLVRNLCSESAVATPVPGLGDLLSTPSTSGSTSSSTPLSSHRLTKLPGLGHSRLCIVCKEDGGIKRRTRTWCPPCNAGVHKECFTKLQHFFRWGRGYNSKIPRLAIQQ